MNEKYILSIPLICHIREKYNLRKYDSIMSNKNQKKMLNIVDEFESKLNVSPVSNAHQKIIHQIWIGNNPMPEKWINTWKNDYIQKNPDWQHILWDEEKLNAFVPDMFNGEVYMNEKTFNGKSDIARYEILYKYGGVYIDADSIWLGTKSLNDLLIKDEKKEEKKENDDTNQEKWSSMFAGLEPTKDYVASGVVGSPKAHPNLLLIINAIRRNYEIGNGERFLQWMTYGPLVLHVLENNKLGIRRLESHLFYPEYWHKNRITALSEEKKNEYSKKVICINMDIRRMDYTN